MDTPDQDFLDLDWYKSPRSSTLVIISHGLEGDTQRPYMLGMANYLFQQELNVLCWNYRSCSEEMNRQKRFYHLGATDDLHWVIQHALNTLSVETLYLVGFSAGGNLTLKYLGEQPTRLPAALKKAVVFSVPCNLSKGAQHLKRWQNFVYERRFMKSLRHKIQTKAAVTTHQFDLQRLRHIKHIWDFDEYFTAPLHGFEGAEDYYARAGSERFIPSITTPTLLVNALNDPFLPSACYPFEEAQASQYVYLETPDTGGHCGFYQKGGWYWSEARAYEFLTTAIS
ncbi:MAG: YheT family hydrolase [Thermonemataceae bacterium]